MGQNKQIWKRAGWTIVIGLLAGVEAGGSKGAPPAQSILSEISPYTAPWMRLYPQIGDPDKYIKKISQYGLYSFYENYDSTIDVKYDNAVYRIESSGCTISPIEIKSGLFNFDCGDLFGPVGVIVDIPNRRELSGHFEFVQLMDEKILILDSPNRAEVLKTPFLTPIFHEISLNKTSSYRIDFPYPVGFYADIAKRCVDLQILSEQIALSFNSQESKEDKVILTPKSFGDKDMYKKCSLKFVYDVISRRGAYSR